MQPVAADMRAFAWIPSSCPADCCAQAHKTPDVFLARTQTRNKITP